MRYAQMNSKSADFNDFNLSRSGQVNNWGYANGKGMQMTKNFGDRGSEISHERRNSADGEQMYPNGISVSAFESKKTPPRNEQAIVC